MFTRDGGATWTLSNLWTGAGTGDVIDIHFVNDVVGYMVWNSAGGVGEILRTINGGYTWEVLDSPTVGALNALVAPRDDLCFAVGEVNGGTTVLLKAHS